jgi:hypothetical protein
MKLTIQLKCRLLSPIIFSIAAWLASPLAAAESDIAAEPDINYWSSYAGVNIDDEGGSFLMTGLSYLPTESTLVGLDVSYANSADDYKMAYTSLLVSHYFGPAALTFGASWMDTEDFGNRTRFTGAMSFTPGPWLLDLTAQVGHENFDPFLVIENPGSVSQQSMMADCEWDQAVLGINLSWTGARWRVYVGGDHYNYNDLRCSYSSTATNTDLPDKNTPDISDSMETVIPDKNKPDISDSMETVIPDKKKPDITDSIETVIPDKNEPDITDSIETVIPDKKKPDISDSKETVSPVKKKSDISVLRPTRNLSAVKARPPARLAAGNTSDVLISFQDHSLNAGVSYQFDTMLAGVDWYWAEEVIDNFETTTWSGYVLFPLSKTTDLELSAGIETGDLEDTLIFIGGRLFWSW